MNSVIRVVGARRVFSVNVTKQSKYNSKEVRHAGITGIFIFYVDQGGEEH